jgi:hypothetical protein
MTDEEYRIHLDFKKNKYSSVLYLMRKYKIDADKAYEYMEMLSHKSTYDVRTPEGKIFRVFL